LLSGLVLAAWRVQLRKLFSSFFFRDVIRADRNFSVALHQVRDCKLAAIAAFLSLAHILKTFRQRRREAELWNFEGRAVAGGLG
jgi:hypothetical protein